MSIGVHVLALSGAPLPQAVFALHLGVFVAFGPVVFAMVKSAHSGGYDLQDFRQQRAFYREFLGAVPRWQRVALYAAFAYFLGHFAYSFAGFFLGWMDPDVPPLRFFSAGWIAAYLGSAVLAKRLLSGTTTDRAPRAV